MIMNIYSMITIIISLIIIAIMLYIAIKNKVNFEFSKDKLSLSTNRGQYISSDKIKSVNMEIEKLYEIIHRIKTTDIIHEQMKYLERQSLTYYTELQSMMPEQMKTEKKKNFELHRFQMLDVFRDEVLKKNHFLEKKNWDGYKTEIFQFCFDRSCELFIKVEENDKVKILVLDEDQLKELKYLFGKYFYCWMDKFRSITEEKVAEIKELQTKIKELNTELGLTV